MAMQESFPSAVSLLAPAVLSALGVTLALMVCLMRQKRKMEGKYRPSAEEKKQAGSEKPGLALPLPKEERLI